MDITQKVKPPRTVFVNYPLGHTSGKPGNPADQKHILSEALKLLENGEPGQIKKLNLTWDDPDWQEKTLQQ